MDDLNKRFKILSLISLGLIIVSLVIPIVNISLFTKSTFLIGVTIALWFLVDYLMLRNNKYYFLCLLIALAFLISGATIRNYYINTEIPYARVWSFVPFSLLLIQRPLRIIYKAIFKREPKIDGEFPEKQADGFYMLILSIGSVILAFTF